MQMAVRVHPFITYAKFLGFWTPSPPCSLSGLNHRTKFTQPCLLHSLLGTGASIKYVRTEGEGGRVPKSVRSKRGCVNLLLWFSPKSEQGGEGVQKAGKSAYVLNGRPLNRTLIDLKPKVKIFFFWKQCQRPSKDSLWLMLLWRDHDRRSFGVWST